METKYQIIIVLLILAIGFITYDQGNEYLQEQKQTSYDLGRKIGMLEWDEEVKNTINNEGKLPTWFFNNNTNQYIKQTGLMTSLCENFR